MSELSAMDELRSEHASALAYLAELMSAVEQLGDHVAQWPEVGPGLRDRFDVARRSLLLHLRKEEEGLYPLVQHLATATRPGQPRAPELDVLRRFFGDEADDDLTAHQLLRVRCRELSSMLDAFAAAGRAEPAGVSRFRSTVERAQDLVARHTEKEGQVIFPLIERLLDKDQLASARERIRAIGASR